MIYAALYFITEPNVKFFLKVPFIKGSVERLVEQLTNVVPPCMILFADSGYCN